MKKTSLITLALLFSILGIRHSALGAGLPELDRVAASVAGSEASFTQRFTPKGFSTSTLESGSVVFGDLPMMRWSYTTPEQKLFVFDGRHSWFYVPGDKQVTVTEVDDSRRADLPFLLIGDPAARERLFNISEATRDGSVVTTLQPKNAAAQIRSVIVTTSASSHMLQRIEYTDREGNHTSFDFSGFHKRNATPDLFHFTPPAGVQVVEAR
jgi:outer membrane lipoprotein carrier protein